MLNKQYDVHNIVDLNARPDDCMSLLEQSNHVFTLEFVDAKSDNAKIIMYSHKNVVNCI